MRSTRYKLPPLDLLLAFEAAARHLSFTRAGQELFLTQSAVSRQIQALEDDLGARLFERRTRALALTEQGEQLYRTAQEVLQKLHDSTARLRGGSGPRTVTLTTTPGFAALWLIPRLGGFRERHAGIDVRISASNEVVNLERSNVDLAIRYLQTERAGDLLPLFGEEVFPVCSPRLASRKRFPLREPDDLRHHVLLCLDDPRAAWFDWGLWFHALGQTEQRPAGAVHFSHYDQLIAAAVDGQGVALGRSALVRRLLRNGQLIAPFKQTVASPRGYFLVRSSDSVRKAEVDAFVQWLQAETELDMQTPVRRRR